MFYPRYANLTKHISNQHISIFMESPVTGLVTGVVSSLANSPEKERSFHYFFIVFSLHSGIRVTMLTESSTPTPASYFAFKSYPRRWYFKRWSRMNLSTKEATHPDLDRDRIMNSKNNIIGVRAHLQNLKKSEVKNSPTHRTMRLYR